MKKWILKNKRFLLFLAPLVLGIVILTLFLRETKQKEQSLNDQIHTVKQSIADRRKKVPESKRISDLLTRIQRLRTTKKRFIEQLSFPFSDIPQKSSLQLQPAIYLKQKRNELLSQWKTSAAQNNVSFSNQILQPDQSNLPPTTKKQQNTRKKPRDASSTRDASKPRTFAQQIRILRLTKHLIDILIDHSGTQFIQSIQITNNKSASSSRYGPMHSRTPPISFSWKGTPESVSKIIYDLQRPGSFVFIRSCSMNTEQTTPNNPRLSVELQAVALEKRPRESSKRTTSSNNQPDTKNTPTSRPAAPPQNTRKKRDRRDQQTDNNQRDNQNQEFPFYEKR